MSAPSQLGATKSEPYAPARAKEPLAVRPTASKDRLIALAALQDRACGRRPGQPALAARQEDHRPRTGRLCALAEVS